jgi:hypothetical protein
MTDAEIGAMLRPILAMTAERDRNARIIEELRTSSDPDARARRDAAVARTTELDRAIGERTAETLADIGLWHGSTLIEQAIEAAAD